MKLFTVVVISVSFLFSSNFAFSQAKKKADKETIEWRYEIEAVGTGIQGTYQVKVWSYSKKPQVAIEQAKKNAVHGIVFKGVPGTGRVSSQKALVQDSNLDQEKENYFNEFFKDGGKYQKFVTLVNNGAISPEDRIKMGKEYKIGIVVSISSAALRKSLEDAGIIKGLGSGF